LDRIFQKQRFSDNKSLFERMEQLSNFVEEYHSICEQHEQTPSNEVLEWRDITFNNILSTEVGGSESDGHDLAKALSDHPITGSLAK
jgi:hypothetical protein